MIKKLKLSDCGKIINDAYKEALYTQSTACLDCDEYTQDDWDRFVNESDVLFDMGLIDGGGCTLEELEDFTFMAHFPLAFEEFEQELESNSHNYYIIMHHLVTGNRASIFDFKEDFILHISDKEKKLLVEHIYTDEKNQYDDICQTLENLLALEYEISDIDEEMKGWLMAGEIESYELLKSAMELWLQRKGFKY